jgi:hypothetical protein
VTVLTRFHVTKVHKAGKSDEEMLRAFSTAVMCLAVLMLPLHASCFTCNDVTQTVSVSPVSYQLPQGADFSLIWITDTQYLSESYPEHYDSLFRWVVNNAEKYNVKMVIHTGDMIQDEFNTTQWENANQSMSFLLDADIPYCWNAGNHDYTETCWIGNQYTAFNPEVLSTKSYWINETGDGQNTAVHFSVDEWDFLVVNIAYMAGDDVLEWANNVLDTYSESCAIVGAHVYLNRTGGYTGSCSNWALRLKNTVLDKHSNVFLTLSGHHYPTDGARTQVGGRHELLYNRQDTNNQTGAASLRIMSFNLAEGKINVETFDLYTNSFLDDENNQFTLTTTFHNNMPEQDNIDTEFPVVTVVLVSVVVVTAVVVCYWRLRRR